MTICITATQGPRELWGKEEWCAFCGEEVGIGLTMPDLDVVHHLECFFHEEDTLRMAETKLANGPEWKKILADFKKDPKRYDRVIL